MLFRSNSLIIVEHNLEIIRNADWIIDLGPGAGVNGGNLLFSGTPEELLKQKTPTAQSLNQYLKSMKF